MADNCKYCHEDSEGYVEPLSRYAHARIEYDSLTKKKALSIGYTTVVQINYCPMCGRRLNDG